MPVDIATGAVRLAFDDTVIPGKVNLVWNRLYTSKLLKEPAGALGRGWTCRYYATLSKTPEGYRYRTPDGDLEDFADPEHGVERGGLVRRLGTYEELFLQNQRYVVQNWDVESGEIVRYCFSGDQTGQPLRLTSVEDVSGQALDLVWDDQGRLSSIRQRLEKRALVLTHGRAGFITAVTLHAPNGERHPLVRYEYNSRGQLAAVYDAAEFADRYEYDDQGRVHREIVKDGGVFHYRYDEKGRCNKTTGLGRYAEKRLRYFDAIRFTEVTDSYDRTFRYQHLPSGQIAKEIDPLGNEKSTEYDEHGRIVAKIDATGATTRYTYDDAGNRNSVTDALGHSYQFTFNGHHLARSMTDPLGHVWWRGYDQSNRLIGTQDPLGHKWLIRYDAEGNVAEIQNPLGALKRQKYTDGVLQAVTDWVGNITRFQLDAFGRVGERTGAMGEVTRFRYDALGNPIEVILPDQTVLRATYDGVGNLTSFIDGNGHRTRFRYGPCQRLLERIDPVGGIVQYVWGSEPRRLDQVVNEKGETYIFFRDDAGRILREKSFDGAERNFNYDAGGYAIAYTNANGETITIRRDALHRVIGQTLPDGEQVSYVFDPIGNLISAVNSHIPVSFERDPLGRIVKELQGEQWVESRYNAVGKLIRTTTSLGHTVDYELDANGLVSKLTTLGNQSLEFGRNANGQETYRQMPSSLFMEQRYDDLGRLVEQRIGPGRLGNEDASVIPQQRDIIRRNYSYDHNGSLASVVDNRWGRVDYAYDPAERLLRAIRQEGPSEEFAYDATGNIIGMQTRGIANCTDEILVYGAGSRVLQKGGTRYEYHAEGRRIKKIEDADSESPKVWLYEWNVLDRLTSVTRPDGVIWRYKYDAFERRIEKSDSKHSSQFLLDKNLIIHEFAGKQALSSWIFDTHSFAPIATVQKNQLYSITNDHLGTPREIFDAFGKLKWSIALLSFGHEFKNNNSMETLDCPLRFQGQWYDDEIKISYSLFRYYDPEIGHFIQRDPIRLIGGRNLYLYTHNPINWIDPYGLTDSDVKPADYRSPTQIEPGTRRVEVTKLSEATGQPYQHVAHYDEQGRLVGQTHYTDHGRPQQHTVPHHHERDPVTGQNLKSPPGTEPGAGTRAWPGPHPDEVTEEPKKKADESGEGCS